MEYSGNLLKMMVENGNPIRYFITLNGAEILVNDWIGKSISIRFNGQINCIHCGKRIPKAYNQGFCFNCLQTAPEASESVLRPELSMSHLGISRDLEWAIEHDLIDHFVYLAVTGNLKVGVTRHHQLPIRWIDQGADRTIILAKAPNRKIAGIIETFLTRFVSDKTNWQIMLKGESDRSIDLSFEKERLSKMLPLELKQYISTDNTIQSFQYPIVKKPSSIVSLKLDKVNTFTSTLTGIKGQYLLFDDGTVFNVRKHSGYYISVII